MTSSDWSVHFDNLMSEYGSKSVQPSESRPLTDWITGRPWIYIDHIMRILVPDSDVFLITNKLVKYLSAKQFSITCCANVKDTAEMCKEISQFTVDEENKVHIVNLSHSELLSIFQTIIEKKFDTKIIHTLIKSKEPSRLMALQRGGQIFVEGTQITFDEKKEIVKIILENYGKSQEFNTIKNRLKSGFQVVIMHRRAPVIIYPIK